MNCDTLSDDREMIRWQGGDGDRVAMMTRWRWWQAGDGDRYLFVLVDSRHSDHVQPDVDRRILGCNRHIIYIN